MADPEEPLAGGNTTAGVVRRGNTVRRPAGHWTPTVHRLLAHLAATDYPAPRPLGVDDRGREILTFIPGEAVHPHRLELLDGEPALRRVGRLIADYHRAQSGFDPTPNDRWREEGRDPTGSTEVVAHNDLAPWNLIAGPSGFVFIDWDLAAPGRRFWDLAWALHSFVGLWPADTDAADTDDRTTDDTVRRIAAFCDGAEVDRAGRAELLAVVVERTADHAAMLRRRADAGDRIAASLVADGHADRWDQGAQHVAENRDRWSARLLE
ncbi:MAG: phosphotransferase [Actinomycetota bacterium]